MPTQPPNILLIVTDQQRADTIHALGNEIIKTPALDDLCRSGTAFTRAYTAAPICSPTRISMLTGLPPHVHRFTDHDWFHREPEGGGRSSAPHDSGFPELLADCGYQTFWSGKVHHSGRPWLFDGVQEYCGGEKHISNRTAVLSNYQDFCRRHGYQPYATPEGGLASEYYMVPQWTDAPVEHTHAHWVAQNCIDFLSRRDATKPFLMHCFFPEPHPPVVNPLPWALLYRAREMEAPVRPSDYEQYQSRTNRYQLRYKGKDTAQEDDTGWRIFKAAYYSYISFIDYNIGRLLDALGDERENTLIVFTTDHGEMLGDYGCAGKRCMLEASIRVPFVASWPGRIPSGATCDTPVSLTDLFPTVLDAAGIEDRTRSEEYRSILEVANAPESDGRRIVFSQFASGWCGQYGATDGRFKYAYSAPDHREWLFRVGDDLEEGANLMNAATAAGAAEAAETSADDSEAARALERLKGALLRRHDPSVDPWSEAVEAGDWKSHIPPTESYLEDPTYGYLDQDRDSAAIQEQIDELGPYARKVTGIARGNLHKDHMVCGGKSPFDSANPK
jgi:choline-sulfatase